jgi:hypothetical protein
MNYFTSYPYLTQYKAELKPPRVKPWEQPERGNLGGAGVEAKQVKEEEGRLVQHEELEWDDAGVVRVKESKDAVANGEQFVPMKLESMADADAVAYQDAEEELGQEAPMQED